MGTELMPGIIDTDGRFDAAAGSLIPWIEQVCSLAGRTVLEYGCGMGFVSRAFAARAGRHIGFDIDESAVDLGRQVLAYAGLDNAELHHAPVETIAAEVERFAGEVDVFLLYAVVEHLTVPERLDVLALARRVVRRDGVIVVCEAPNRLIDFDHHTAQMPYFSQLPDDLALRYARNSRRGDFTAAMADAAGRGGPAAREALARWGRGVSFHEFELAFGDLRRHVIASNYDPLLMGVRPVQPDEQRLARGLEEYRPDLAPVFGRYWLDLILSPIALPGPPSFIRPWMMDTRTSQKVAYAPNETLHLADGARLHARLRAPSRELMVGVIGTGEPIEVEVRGATGQASAIVTGPPGGAGYVVLALDSPEREVELRLDAPAAINFVGYRG
ncbi:MAG TPA: class I SAM-dependent methyltransferase [Solirubrobacteraceae bacterium]